MRSLTEWAVLLAETDHEKPPPIRTPTDAANLMMLEMSLLEQEEVRVLGLDTKQNLICRDTVYRGSVNTALIRMSEILRKPILHNCCSMIVLHNHPSGDPTPSPSDVEVTKLIAEGGKLMDVELLDHLIIGQGRFVSLKEQGLGFG